MRNYIPTPKKPVMRAIELERVQRSMLDSVPHQESEEVKEYRAFLANLYEWMVTKEESGEVHIPSGSLRKWVRVWRQYLDAKPCLLPMRALVVVDFCLRYAVLPEIKGMQSLKFKRARWAVVYAYKCCEIR